MPPRLRTPSAASARAAGIAPAASADDSAAAAALVAWFGKSARDLPWRHAPAGWRDPYTVLVAEAMLQQTQVSRVIERFPRFLERFPSLAALAAADEHDVLAEWSGMGYYRRARNLHAAARAIVRDHDGRVPSDPDTLRSLPGIGRYTAGAIASMAFGKPAPIVDGNVARVLLRIHGRDAAADDRSVQTELWRRAELLVAAAPPGRAGIVNEALMELGATVCTPPPTAPRCDRCPLRAGCIARQQGSQGRIPRPKARARQRNLFCGVAVIARRDGTLLIEQRPSTGMWAGLWQAPTVERDDRPVDAPDLALALGIARSRLKPDASFEHQTTHRRVHFRVWRADADASFNPVRGLWMSGQRIAALGLSNPQRRILLEEARGGTLWT